MADFRSGRLTVLDWEQLAKSPDFDLFCLHLHNGSGPPRAVDAIVHPR
jgi:hypothetical protein